MNTNGTYSDESADGITDMYTERQAIDIAYQPVRRSNFNPYPIVIAVAIAVGFYFCVAVLGIIISVTVSRSNVKNGFAFNTKVNHAVDCYECIPSDEGWKQCDNFCNDKTENNVLNRTRKILHQSKPYSCDGIELAQTLKCIDGATLNDLPWTEWSVATATGKRYRIRDFPSLAVYRNVKGNENLKFEDSEVVNTSVYGGNQ